MPAVFTHVQFGKEVAAILPSPLREWTDEHPAAFYLGTQGPDILFYHKPFKAKEKNPIRKRGWDTHAQPAAPFFVMLAKKIADEPSDALRAYAIGFLCHFTLDSHTHPFIDGNSTNGLSHGKIEAELDKFYLRKNGKPTRGFNVTNLFANSEESKLVGAKALDVPEKNMQIMLRSTRRVNGLFTNKSGFVHGFCHAALTLIGMNDSFGEMFLYKKDDERCAPLFSTLSALFNEAIPKAAKQITAYFARAQEIADTGVLDNDFYRYDYSGLLREEETRAQNEQVN